MTVRATGKLEIERRDAGGTQGFAFRVPTELELRSKDGAKMPGIRGYSAVFDSWSEPLGFYESFREKIASGAFKKTISESDIRALRDHDPSMLFGRSKGSAGGTLKLGEDSNGLEMEVEELPDTDLGRELVALIERGDLDGQSFGFRTVKDEWDYEVSPEDKAEGIEAYRTLTEVRLFDVGPVTYPAYPETTAEVRSKIAHLDTVRAERAARGNGDADRIATMYRQRLAELELRGAALLG